MRIDDEPLEAFYPRCCICGEAITEKGYLFDGYEFYCEDCITDEIKDGAEVIDGQNEAEENRYAAYENAQERFYNYE